MRVRLIGAVAAAAAVATVLVGGHGVSAAPALGVPAHVPGPVWLHMPRATTPILENAGGWRAEPLLVSGADAYVDGEYLFQDFVHDNYGANTTDVPLAPPDTSPGTVAGLASAPTGDLAQPTDADRFANDAGDFMEIRVRTVDGGIAYRFTMNALLDQSANAVAVGIDSVPGTGSSDWGAGIGSLGALGLDHVLVVSGQDVLLDGDELPVAEVSEARNQIEVVVPLTPGVATWRHYAVAGVSDGNGGFASVLEEPDATHPGGAHGTDAPPVLNVGFRRADQEPMGVETTETGGRGAYGYGSWRDHAQAKALAARDISEFAADIDFNKLNRHVRESNVPTSGFMDRLYVSHLADLGEGVRRSLQPGGSDVLLGPVQPYALYVPPTLDDSQPAPFTLLLHAAACNYNQYGVQAPQLHDLLGDERRGIVATPQARGQTVGYSGLGEVDTFEVWADVASRYLLDFDRVALTGISMGAIGSLRLASLYPDLFARVFPIAGHGQAVIDIAENLRNVPLLMWNGLPDELVRVDQYLSYQQRLEALRYRHELDVFPATDHLVHPLGAGTDFSRGAAFLGEDGTDPIDRDPRRVTYRVVPRMANSLLGLTYGGAYWVGGIRVVQGRPHGTVDVTDLAAEEGEPLTTVFTKPGTDPEAHVARGVKWTPTRNTSRPNGLLLELAGVSDVTIDVGRTSIDTNDPVVASVVTDGDVLLNLLGLRRGSKVLLDGNAVGKVGSKPFSVTIPTGEHVVTVGR